MRQSANKRKISITLGKPSSTASEKQVCLDSQEPLDLETDNAELEAELLKSVEGPFTPYSSEEMHAIGQRIIKTKLGK